jgi:hypothetical protein
MDGNRGPAVSPNVAEVATTSGRQQTSLCSQPVVRSSLYVRSSGLLSLIIVKHDLPSHNSGLKAQATILCRRYFSPAIASATFNMWSLIRR